jgi:Dolichyl-phosphate-mannose-protein mannosyltransferase
MQAIRAALSKLWLIALFALCIRIGFAFLYIHSAPKQAFGIIPFLFEPGHIAYSLVHGNGFSSPLRVDTGPTAWMAPVYPLLLAAIFKIWGSYTFSAYLAAMSLNIGSSVLTCVPIFWIGKNVSGAGVAAGATWLWAIFPNAILLPVESMWDASLAALLCATILWQTLTLADSSGVRNWCLYGVLWGGALMTSPTLVLLLPPLLLWLSWRLRANGLAWRTRPALAAGVTVLCCLPWTIRNYSVFHAFIPFRSVLGLQLWVGNNERAPDWRPGEVHPLSSSAERAQYVSMGEIAYMRVKERKALEFARTHPRIEAMLIADRFVATWTGGTPHPLADCFRIRSSQFRGVLLFNLFVAIGSWCGMAVLLWNRNPYGFPVIVAPLLFPIPAYLTLASARYRHPVDPAILLLTAVALSWCSARWHGHLKNRNEPAR